MECDMKVTVDNVEFFEFLLDVLIKQEEHYKTAQADHDSIQEKYDQIKKNQNIFQKFLNACWFDSAWHEAVGDDWSKFYDIYQLREMQRRIKDTEHLVSVFAYNIQSGLTSTSEIEYTSWYLKEYIKQYGQ